MLNIPSDGLTVEICKPSYGDCSAGGLSSQYTTALLIDAITATDEAKARPDAVILKPGHYKGTCIAVPFENSHRRGMAGGCFISSCDSRFNRAVESITDLPFYGAIPLHDRFE